MRRIDYLQMYRQYPDALKEEVLCCLTQVTTPETIQKHNIAVERITRLFASVEGQQQMFNRVVHAIIDAADSENPQSKNKEKA